MLLSVIIPVFNEVKTINAILDRVRAVPVDKQIILIDDASSDGTRAIIETQSRLPDTSVVLHEHNQGKGAAIRTGLQYVEGDFAVVQDADLEYDPMEYTRLLEPLTSGLADVVYGSRFLGAPEKMSSLHKWGNLALTKFTNLLYQANLTDMETCYKVFRADVLKSMVIESNRFDFEPEVTAKVLRLGFRVREIPIAYRGREFHEGKKITWRDGVAAIKALVRYRIASLQSLQRGTALPPSIVLPPSKARHVL